MPESYGEARKLEKENPKGWAPDVYKNLLGGTGEENGQYGRDPTSDRPKLIPDKRINHGEVARLKKEAHERKKLERVTKAQDQRGNYEKQLKNE
jgi:hypothetical protein